MNHEIGYLIGVILILYISQISGMSGLRQSTRRLERKLDAIIKHQGVEWPSGISAEVRLMAQDPRKRIFAIKLHRDQNPDLGLAEAKKDVEDCVSGK
jgi:ribosomal protein L7/L12